jgi:hypothetical protein
MIICMPLMYLIEYTAWAGVAGVAIFIIYGLFGENQIEKQPPIGRWPTKKK